MISVWKLSSASRRALGDLSLVGRVGGVPAGILEDVALDDRWCDRFVVPHAQVRTHRAIALRKRAKVLERFSLGEAGTRVACTRQIELEGGGDPNVFGYCSRDEGSEVVEPEGSEHGARLVVVGAEMTAGEIAPGLRCSRQRFCRRLTGFAGLQSCGASPRAIAASVAEPEGDHGPE